MFIFGPFHSGSAVSDKEVTLIPFHSPTEAAVRQAVVNFRSCLACSPSLGGVRGGKESSSSSAFNLISASLT